MATTKRTAAAKEVAPKSPSKPKKAVKKVAPISHGVGRRKSSTARVWLLKGSGNIVVNGKEYKSYFDTDVVRLAAHKPFDVIASASGYDAHANVEGGGVASQADAIKLGIARAIVALDENLRSELRQHGLLTVDDRLKERKKYGRKAARRSFQFVKR